jgi:hypothetical protein
MVAHILGDYITNSDKKQVAVQDICDQHIMEDLSFIPTVEEYVSLIPHEDWHIDAYNALVEALGDLQKYPTLYEFTRNFLLEPLEDPRSVVFVAHAMFPFFAEKALGPMIGKKATRDVVEETLGAYIAFNPPSDVVRNIEIPDWMIRPALLKKEKQQGKKKKNTTTPIASPKEVIKRVEIHHHHSSSKTVRFD